MKFNRLAFIFILFSFTCKSWAQNDDKKRGGRPDLPGTFLLELGFSTAQNTPENFTTGLWGSRTFNIYYQHEFTIPILKKKFSFVPGIGLGLDRLKFTNNYTMAFESGDLTMTKMNLDINKSQFVTNYFDIPIELKYTKNSSDPNRSLKISVGFRGGVLMNAYTKIRYNDENDSKVKDKSKRDWNVNRFRYGPYGKVGFGNLSLFAYSNISTLFESNKGPDESNINTITFGVSLSGF